MSNRPWFKLIQPYKGIYQYEFYVDSKKKMFTSRPYTSRTAARNGMKSIRKWAPQAPATFFDSFDETGFDSFDETGK